MRCASRADRSRPLTRACDVRGGAPEVIEMKLPLQVTFRNIPPSEALVDYVRTKADKLETFFDRITSCRVAVETPHRHGQHGRHYRIRVDLTVPGAEVVVGHDQNRCAEDAYAAVDDAFKNAERLLKAHAERLRFSRGSSASKTLLPKLA
jgi:ribosomal subunit interface protein